MQNVTLRQLRVFASVARQLGFARAARELHLTPPAVSMQIRDLEEQVGLPLFDRSARQVSLTVTGEYLLVYARKVLATMKDAEDALARFRGLETGRLAIGMVSTAEYFLPRLLTRFRVAHAGLEIRLIVSANREQLVTALRGTEIDLAIMGRPPVGLATRAEPFAVHPHIVVTPPEHRLLRQQGCAPARVLNEHSFIVRESGSGTRAAMMQYFERMGIEPRIEMEMTSNETIKQAVMAGMGISFLSMHTVGLELKSGLLAAPEVEGLPIVRRWYIVNSLAKVLSPAAEAFRHFILAEGERFLAAEFGAWQSTYSA